MVRLRSRAQFQAVLAGDRLAVSAHFVLHRLQLPEPDSINPSGAAGHTLLFKPVAVWIGAMVPKRWAKRAVTRNAMKRQIYNVSHQFEDDLLAAAYLVRLRAGFDSKLFVSASSDVLQLALRRELHTLFSAAVSALAVKPATTPV